MNVLTIDIGGTGLKGAVVSPSGEMLTDRLRVKTQAPTTPGELVEALVALVAPLGDYGYVSVGFPGVVRNGVILTAPNLGTEQLRGFDLASGLGARLGKPVRIVNDAEMQGMSVIQGKGYEVVITLGTGMGFAIFTDGNAGPHLELSHHPFRHGETYDEQLGNAALKSEGHKKWNHRVETAIDMIRVLTNFDHLYIGGGNAEEIQEELPSDVTIVSNQEGIRGGAWLWRDKNGSV
jgi:polyphosphate glucokinase